MVLDLRLCAVCKRFGVGREAGTGKKRKENTAGKQSGSSLRVDGQVSGSGVGSAHATVRVGGTVSLRLQQLLALRFTSPPDSWSVT